MVESFVVLLVAALVLSVLLWYFKRQQAPPSAKPITERTDLDLISMESDGSPDNWLVGTGGEVMGKVYKVGNRTVTIGRDVGTLIQLEDSEVSRRHCQLSPVPDGLRVIDMKSRNGTLVNGKRVSNAVVQDGGEIQVGDAKLMYCRNADFDTDDSLAAKKAGAQAKMFTQAAGGLGFKQQLRDALKAANGDYDKAAAYLDMDVRLFRKVIEMDQ